MKNNILTYVVIAGMVLATACGRKDNVQHLGNKEVHAQIIMCDTLEIDDNDLSAQYNVFMSDSLIVFADHMKCCLNLYSLVSGDKTGSRLSYGHGPDQLSSMIWATPFENNDSEVVIVDAANGLYIYNLQNSSLENKGPIDFNWGKGLQGDYDDISNYNMLEMVDFAVSVSKSDNSILLPTSLISRNFTELNSDRYEKGHIFANLNLEDMKVGKPFGQFPEAYKKKPLPFFEFFDFTVTNDGSIVYSFAPDSLIYLADAEGRVKNTFGFEAPGINRDYTVGFDADHETFREDTGKVGVNTELYYDSDKELLFRTSLADVASGTVILQVYDNSFNLIAESQMPKYFKILGKYGNKYYGARFIPEESEDSLKFVIFAFQIN